MKMPVDMAESLQWDLLVLSKEDDMSCIHFAKENSATTSTELSYEKWQESVDMIYRLLTSGLVLWSSRKETNANCQSLHEVLTQNNPFNQNELGEWMIQYLHASDFCKKLIEKYNIHSTEQPLCVAFIEELESVFEKWNVAWSSEALLSIMPCCEVQKIPNERI